MIVSVVIPVYNTERYVAASIDSVLAQTRPPAEVIVVDDGSTDGTSEILRSFGGRIVMLRQQQSGAAVALNTGIAGSAGDFLAFQDADDLWLPEKLALQCDLLARQPEVEAVFGHARQFVSPDLEDGGAGLEVPDRDQVGVHKGAMLIRRPAFERVGPFDPSLTKIEFGEWYARAIALGLRTHILPDVVILRRLHATNTGRVHRDEQREQQLLALKRSLDLRRRGGTDGVC
jgi:glycosyltransferase involved in cell wall biosynthesis